MSTYKSQAWQQFIQRVAKETSMATTTTTPTLTTSPAAVVERQQKAAAKKAAPPNPKKVVNFGLWKEAQSQARQIVGYTTTSPIYGKTEQKVFAELLDLLADGIAGTATYKDSLAKAHAIVVDLQKRKVADEIAAKNYKQAIRAKA